MATAWADYKVRVVTESCMTRVRRGDADCILNVIENFFPTIPEQERQRIQAYAYYRDPSIPYYPPAPTEPEVTPDAP